MSKPPVPQGLITFEEGAPRISLGSVRSRLQALATDPLLDRIDNAIRAEDWQVATGLLYVLGNNVAITNGSVSSLINRINKKRHSPLFPELEATDCGDLHDH